MKKNHYLSMFIIWATISVFICLIIDIEGHSYTACSLLVVSSLVTISYWEKWTEEYKVKHGFRWWMV